MNILEKLLLFFLFFLPFQFALNPTEGVDLAIIRVGAITLFLGWAIQCFLKKKLLLPQARTLFFFLGYIFWAILSLLWVENMDWALRKVLFLLSFFPLLLAFFAVLQSRSFRLKAYRTIVLSALFCSFIALGQFFSQFIFGVEKVFAFWTETILPFFLGPNFGAAVADYPSLLVNISGNTVMRAVAFFPDPHMLSFFLGMIFPLAVVLTLKSDSRNQIWWGISSLCILGADLLTFSRGGYVGLIVGMGIFSLVLLLERAHQTKQRVRIGISIIVVLGGIVLSPIGTRLLSSFSESDTSNTERVRLWQESLTFITEHPILGTGIGNYSLFVKPSATYREPIYAHNLYLDIASETGLLGLFFFCGFLVMGMLTAWKKWWREQDIFSLAFFSSLILFSAHAFFETPLYSVHIVPLLLFLIASSLGELKKEEG